MILRKIAFCFMSCLSVTGYTQSFLPIQHDTAIYQHEIIVNGNLDMGSTKLQNNISNRFLWGGSISKDMAAAASNKMAAMNRTGVTAEAEFEYRNLSANIFNENWGFLVKGGYYAVGTASYTGDLFGLVMKGNEEYLGRSVNLNGSGIRFNTFQKIGFGIINKKSKSSVSLSYVNLTTDIRSGVNKGSITFDNDAENVDFLLNGEFSHTKSGQFINGAGAALDVDYRIPINWIKENKAYIQVQIKNFGFAALTSSGKRYIMDSTYHYEGFTIDQLRSFNKDGEFSLMDTLGIRESSRKGVVLLPFYLQFGKIVSDTYPGKWQSFFGVRIYPMPTYSPLFYAGANYRPFRQLDVGASLSYGGFTGFRAGLYLSGNFGKINVGIGSEDIYGALSEKGYGKTLNFRLRCRI